MTQKPEREHAGYSAVSRDFRDNSGHRLFA